MNTKTIFEPCEKEEKATKLRRIVTVTYPSIMPETVSIKWTGKGWEITFEL